MMNGTSIESKLVKLNKQIEDEHTRFKAAAAAAVLGLLSEYGLTLDDIVGPPPAKQSTKVVKKPKTKKAVPKSARKAAVKGGKKPPKYRDPDSGNTWSGFGHAPAWIAQAQDRTPFLIQ